MCHGVWDLERPSLPEAAVSAFAEGAGLEVVDSANASANEEVNNDQQRAARKSTRSARSRSTSGEKCIIAFMFSELGWGGQGGRRE